MARINTCACGEDFEITDKASRQAYSAHIKGCTEYIDAREKKYTDAAADHEREVTSIAMATLDDTFTEDQKISIVQTFRYMLEDKLNGN